MVECKTLRSAIHGRVVPQVISCLILTAGVFTSSAQDTTVLDGGRPATTIVGDTGAPYENIFRPANIGGSAWNPKIGPGRLNTPIPSIGNPQFNVPLINRGMRPEQAEIKIGGLYIDFQDASAAILASDNINATHRNRKNGAISVVRLGINVLFQMNEGLNLSSYGSLIWLPFKGKAGLNGFGITDPIDALFNVAPIAAMQLDYTGTIAGWDFRLLDAFDVTTPNFFTGLQLDQQFEGANFDEIDRAGRYEYRLGGVTSTRGVTAFRDQGLQNVGLVYHNMAGIELHRLQPIYHSANLPYYHHNFWYSGTTFRGVSTMDQINSSLISQRENTRFKPYVRHMSTTDDLRNRWNHMAFVGFFGPATDYINVLGEFGRFWEDGSTQSASLWRLRADHNPGPLTTQSIEYGRTLTRPERTLLQYLNYRIHRQLGPYWNAEYFMERQRVKSLTAGLTGYTLDQIGLRTTYNLGVRSEIGLTMIYQDITLDNPAAEEVDNFVGRLQFIRHHTQTMSSTIMYQLERRDSTVKPNSFYENLIMYRLEKMF